MFRLILYFGCEGIQLKHSPETKVNFSMELDSWYTYKEKQSFLQWQLKVSFSTYTSALIWKSYLVLFDMNQLNICQMFDSESYFCVMMLCFLKKNLVIGAILHLGHFWFEKKKNHHQVGGKFLSVFLSGKFIIMEIYYWELFIFFLVGTSSQVSSLRRPEEDDMAFFERRYQERVSLWRNLFTLSSYLSQRHHRTIKYW